MSYSFHVQAASKEEAKAKAAEQFEAVVRNQPVHARDRDAALANVSAAVDLLADPVPDGMVLSVSCNGYVGWLGDTSDGTKSLTSASISASASYHRPQTT